MKETTKTTKIAVYGTLKRAYGNHRLITHTTFLGEGWTKDKYQLTANGIPFVHKEKPLSKVHVEVFEVKNEDMPNVDALEGHPQWYKREPITIEMENGEELIAELYFNEQEGSTLIKSGKYEDYRR